ncbi:MAG: curli production assembly/transport component csgg [Proteobacteria bacterium SG_bin5]|nr:SH3 domain-containing protein [Sphingomonas sp.]OQW42413.1 MAG: curli production assembly/transport component csgg [Proteobacteria bacterium SG_bin5]
MPKSLTVALFTLPVIAFAAQPVAAQNLAKPSGGQRLQDKLSNDVPKCARKLGTLAIRDGDDARPWMQNNLAPPAKLLRVLVQRSGCFNLVDRGSGLNAAQQERDIGNDLGLQRRSNVGQGQIKAADYVLIAEISNADENVSGSGVAGGVGGLIGGRVGGLLGGVKSRKLEANTVLSLTNVRTTETIAVEEGYAAKNNLSFGAGGFFAIAGAVGGGYDNTDIGKIVTLSFIQAYSKMVSGLGLIQPGDAGTAEAAPAKTFTAQGPVQLRATPAGTAKVIRTLPPGAILYPTGNKNGLWWEVADENDNVGWVLNTKLAPSN